MDRAAIEKHLLQAEAHVALGKEHIQRQQQVILNLEQAGHPTAAAKDLLRTFEVTQAAHEADLERIKKELAALDGNPD